mgnify:CR=1 FL=1
MLAKLYKATKYFLKPPAFNFTAAHQHFTASEMGEIKKLVGKSDNNIIAEYERTFAALIGDGSCVSFSAARMGFYSFMKSVGVGPGDEVILTAFTCSVMANAILKLGAVPVYSDIDAASLGSSPLEIERLVSNKTKMIVAQHSFGIPCDIESIVRIGEKNNIFVLEDCAISLGSKINGRAVGTFGHGAIFSTDHTKPLNTMIGGLFYSGDTSLVAAVKCIRDDSAQLTQKHQQELWRRVIIERLLCRDYRLQYLKLVDYFYNLLERIHLLDGPFLTSDYSALPQTGRYPYPSQMPTFLAFIGILQLRIWNREVLDRVNFLEKLKLLLVENNMSALMPSAYFNTDLQIVPLRLALSFDGGKAFRAKLGALIDIDGTWFLGPLIATPEDPISFGCDSEKLPVSRKTGRDIVNIPCNLGSAANKKILYNLAKIIGKNNEI